MVASSIDRHYTPNGVARALVDLARQREVLLVADLAAGDGALLDVARSKWPAAVLLAVDTDADALSRLQIDNGIVIRCDALSLLNLQERPDVVVLNPPFSYRGGHFRTVCLGAKSFRCSPALAFVIKGIQVVKNGGEVLAVMPSNSLRSEKDRAVWEYIRDNWNVAISGSYDRNTFAGCFPTVQLVHIEKVSPRIERPVGARHVRPMDRAFILRGTLPVARAIGSGSTHMLHSTNLAMHSCAGLRCEASSADIMGPVILLPRVGVCHPEHLIMRVLRHPTRLSECVFAIWGPNERVTRRIYQTIRTNFEWLEAAYHGTCAKYLTLANLSELLERLSWEPSAVRPGWSLVACETAFVDSEIAVERQVT
jgi:hypothetical protein